MTTELTNAEIDSYHRDGFLIVDQLVDPETLAPVKTAYQELLDTTSPSTGDRMLGGLTRQIMIPSDAHPVFMDNAVLHAARAIGEALLGEPVERVFDMLIYKPPRHPHSTPWHQDMAYAGTPTAPAGAEIPLVTMQFWVAIDDVDEQNGCMHFIPGRHHEPLLEHHVASGEPDDPGRLLALTDPSRQLDLTTAVAAPLRAGGCTVHSYGTPHFTPPNRSEDRSRPAYIFNLAPAAYLADFKARRDLPQRS